MDSNKGNKEENDGIQVSTIYLCWEIPSRDPSEESLWSLFMLWRREWLPNTYGSRNHVSNRKRTNGPKSRNTPDTPDFWLENKMFHNNLFVFIILSALFYLLYLLSLDKSLVYQPFKCMMNAVRMRKGDIDMRNIQWEIKNLLKVH